MRFEFINIFIFVFLIWLLSFKTDTSDWIDRDCVWWSLAQANACPYGKHVRWLKATCIFHLKKQRSVMCCIFSIMLFQNTSFMVEVSFGWQKNRFRFHRMFEKVDRLKSLCICLCWMLYFLLPIALSSVGCIVDYVTLCWLMYIPLCVKLEKSLRIGLIEPENCRIILTDTADY